MSNRRMALAGVVAVVIGVLVWWLSGAVRPKRAAKSSDAGAVATMQPADVEQHGPWRAPRQVGGDDTKHDPDGDIRLEGQVIDAQQQPVGGAIVVVSSNPPSIVETEADGSFAFDGLLARTYRINAFKDNARADAQSIRARADTEPVILRMHEGMTVVVTVIDRDSRAPIGGAEVTTGDLLEQAAITDTGGKAELHALRAGGGYIKAEADGYAPGGLRLMLADEPGARVDRTVELRHGAAVSGIVLDPDGKGVGGTAVYGSDGNGGAVLADTADDGTWTIPAVSAGTWTFQCPGERWAPGTSDPVDVDGETPVEGVEIHVQPGRRIVGIVVDEQGPPVAGAAVNGRSEESPTGATSNADGTFELFGLPPDRYVVAATEGDRASEQVPADVRDADVVDLRLTISLATISGVVVDASGEPIAEAQVQARPDPMSFMLFDADLQTVTDSAGGWTLGPVSGKTYSITASRSEAARNPYERMPRNKGTSATRGEHDVKLVLATAGALRATVVRGGEPVTRYAIGFGDHRSPYQVPKVIASADGTFERTGLTPGTYTLTIAGEDFAVTYVEDVEIEAGETKDLGTVEVDPGRTIRGVVVDAAGAPIADASVTVSAILRRFKRASLDDDPMQAAMTGTRQTRTGADGRFELHGVGAESRRPLQLLAEKPGVGQSKETALPEGDVELTIAIETPGAIVVTVAGAGTDDRLIIDAEPEGDGSPTTVPSVKGRPTEVSGLVPGTYKVYAWMSSMRQTPSVTVEVKAGETAHATVTFPSGGVTLVIEHDDDCQVVMLLNGPPGGDFSRDALVATAMCRSQLAVEIPNVQPGAYQLCDGPSECQSITVKASPDRQTFTLK